MKAFRLVFTPEARDDLDRLYAWISDSSGERIAEDFTGRLFSFCNGLASVPERGRRRDDIKPGLRLIGYRRRATIAILVRGDAVTILRVFYRGRDIEALMSELRDAP